MDIGTEMGVISTIHCYLRARNGDLEDAKESILHVYGPSTENKMERWWRELLAVRENGSIFQKSFVHSIRRWSL